MSLPSLDDSLIAHLLHLAHAARGTLALCDGASESFDSSVWAQILADKFARDPAVTPEWLGDAIAEYVSRHDFDTMSWSQQASYERGSFSTLLGAQYDPEHRAVEILSVGDSLAGCHLLLAVFRTRAIQGAADVVVYARRTQRVRF